MSNQPAESKPGKLWTAWQLARHQGIGWMLGRSAYALRKRSGLMAHNNRSFEWAERPLETWLTVGHRHGSHRMPIGYFPTPRELAEASANKAEFERFRAKLQSFDAHPAARGNPAADAARIERGEFQRFHDTWHQRGRNPDWHADATGEVRGGRDRHWSYLDDFAGGDIKLIWDLSRFSFVFPLVRAYYRRYGKPEARECAATFWRLLESWRAANPPYRGANWRCGQEASLRAYAWLFALNAFEGDPESTGDRQAMLWEMIAASAERIYDNFGYSQSQFNNHGITEALGLWIIGLAFPTIAGSGPYIRTAEKALEANARNLIYDDGGFSQHSLNYQRLVLESLLVAIKYGEALGGPLSAELKQRVLNSAEMLYQLQNPGDGRLPNTGQNDGSLLLPLSNCQFDDYRPTIQACTVMLGGYRAYEAGPWDETALWLTGSLDSLNLPVQPPARIDFSAPHSGCYTLRSIAGETESFALLRCTKFKHRPAHADQLHADIWWRGQNVAIDAGTYSYNAPAPWNHPLPSAAFHNTVTVDGRDQMRRASRWVWLPWCEGKANSPQRSNQNHIGIWQGQHDGYRVLKYPAEHRRAVVQLAGDTFIVLDDLASKGTHDYRLHWLLADFPFEWSPTANRLTLKTPAGAMAVTLASRDALLTSLVRGDDATPRGWHAPHYHRREPALSLTADCFASRTRLITMFAPANCQLNIDADRIGVTGQGWMASLDLAKPTAAEIAARDDARDNSWLISRVSLVGTLNDRWEPNA